MAVYDSLKRKFLFTVTRSTPGRYICEDGALVKKSIERLAESHTPLKSAIFLETTPHPLIEIDSTPGDDLPNLGTITPDEHRLPLSIYQLIAPFPKR